MHRGLIAVGLVLLAAGLAWLWLQRLRLGRLPGDFVFHVGGVTIYVPLATMLLASLVLSIVTWLWRR